MENLEVLLICTVLSGLFAYGGATRSVDIDISSYDPENEKTHSYHELVEKIEENFIEIVVKSNNTNHHGFFILQVHSSLHNVSLTHHGDRPQNEVGHNIGMVKFFMEPFTNTFNLEKFTSENITILITVTVYDDASPVPGGCSDTDNKTEIISPIIKVVEGREIITISVRAASLKGISCNTIENKTSVEIYHKFLPSQDFSTYNYYLGILSMLTIEDIRKNGILVSTTMGHPNQLKIFSSYVGVGEVFAVIVTVDSKSAAYVPSLSYGADINILIKNDKNDTSGFVKAVVAILIVIALVLIFCGHAMFHFTTFLIGTSLGSIIWLFLLNQDDGPIGTGTLITVMIMGVLCGLVWLTIWYICGFPLLSAALTHLHAAVLLSCMIYHTGVADYKIFHREGAYWSIFCGIIVACWFIISVFIMFGHIFSCTLLGSYLLMMTTLNNWMNGNMQYIIINVYRRIFVPNFNEAILDPPYQLRDAVTSIIGVIFLVQGLLKQLKNQVGKPPFPPHKSHRVSGEYAPLL